VFNIFTSQELGIRNLAQTLDISEHSNPGSDMIGLPPETGIQSENGFS
jgi:hypothetical protein